MKGTGMGRKKAMKRYGEKKGPIYEELWDEKRRRKMMGYGKKKCEGTIKDM